MRRYETFIILDPDISEDQRSVVLQRTSEVIQQQNGFLAFIDEWGARQLAYEIKKKARGYYVRFDFCGTGAVVTEIERNYRIDDRVLKYMTVLTDESPNLESVKEEIAIAESEKAKAKEQAEAREQAAAKARAEAASQSKAESQPEAQADEQQPKAQADEPQPEAQADEPQPEAQADEPQPEAQADEEQPGQTQAQPEAEEPDTEEQGDKAEKAAVLEAETPEDETVPTDGEEEIK